MYASGSSSVLTMPVLGEGECVEWLTTVSQCRVVRLPPSRSYAEGNLLRVNGLLYDAHGWILDYVSWTDIGLCLTV